MYLFLVNGKMEVENQLVTAVKLLTDVIKSNNPVSVPSPKIFDGTNYHTIEDFFYFYERFCLVTYGNDRVSWLQILPDFLDGKYKCIVDSFGRCKEVTYDTVKLRLIKECNFRSVGDDYLSRYLNTIRKVDETLLCYFIRLEVLVMKLPHVNPNNCESMVRLNLLKAISGGVKHELNMRFGHVDLISNEKLVRIAGMLESEAVNHVPEVAQPLNCNYDRLPGVVTRQKRPVKCFRCGFVGHIRRNCHVRLWKRDLNKSPETPSKIPKSFYSWGNEFRDGSNVTVINASHASRNSYPKYRFFCNYEQKRMDASGRFSMRFHSNAPKSKPTENCSHLALLIMTLKCVQRGNLI